MDETLERELLALGFLAMLKFSVCAIIFSTMWWTS